MKIKDLSKREFICRDGEEITVNVLSKNTVHLVTYRLDQSAGSLAQGQPLTFTLNQATADPSFLTVGFHFSGKGDGAYAIKIIGDPGEDTFQEIYRQNHVPVLFDHFTFDIWP